MQLIQREAGDSRTKHGTQCRHSPDMPHTAQPNPQLLPHGSTLATKTWPPTFYRTARLQEGALLSDVTREIAVAWNIPLQIMPMTNDAVRTLITLANDCEAGSAGSRISFQEYFVKHRHSVAVSKVQFAGADSAQPLCLDVLSDADSIVIAPSNPLVSIAPIRALRGVDTLLAQRRDNVCAISPIVAGSALKGPADRLMTELGHDASVVGVARLYAPICGTLIIDHADAHLASHVEAEGMRCIVTNTIMKTPEITAALAQCALDATS